MTGGQSLALAIFTVTDPDKEETSLDDKDDDSDLYREHAGRPEPLPFPNTPKKSLNFQPFSPMFSPMPAESPSAPIDLLKEAFQECDADGVGELRSDQMVRFVDLLQSKMQAVSDDALDHVAMDDSAKELLLATLQMYCSENADVVDLDKLRELYESAMQRHMTTSFRYALFRDFDLWIVWPSDAYESRAI